MATNSGFSLDYDSILRIARAVWEVERSLGIPGEFAPGDPGGPQNTRMIEVNGAVSGGLYPAICKDHDGANWVYSESCFAVDSNGATLTVGNTYIGRRTRSVTDGGVAKSVFTVQASGGGGAAADNGARFVQFTDRAGTFGIYNGYMLTWSSSGAPQGSGVSVFIQAWGTNSLPVVPSAGQYVIALKISDAYTAPGTPGGANITKPLYVVYGQGYPPPSCVVKPTRETTLLGTYYGELSVISGAGLTGITWVDTTGREVLVHNINSTGVAGSLTVGKRYMGILSGSSFASGTAFGAQANGYPIYTVASP
jgi:hypothetical protein